MAFRPVGAVGLVFVLNKPDCKEELYSSSFLPG